MGGPTVWRLFDQIGIVVNREGYFLVEMRDEKWIPLPGLVRPVKIAPLVITRSRRFDERNPPDLGRKTKVDSIAEKQFVNVHIQEDGVEFVMYPQKGDQTVPSITYRAVDGALGLENDIDQGWLHFLARSPDDTDRALQEIATAALAMPTSPSEVSDGGQNDSEVEFFGVLVTRKDDFCVFRKCSVVLTPARKSEGDLIVEQVLAVFEREGRPQSSRELLVGIRTLFEDLHLARTTVRGYQDKDSNLGTHEVLDAAVKRAMARAEDLVIKGTEYFHERNALQQKAGVLADALQQARDGITERDARLTEMSEFIKKITAEIEGSANTNY